MPDFAVVAEDDTDARMALLLANRIFLEEGPDWMDQAYLPNWVDLQGQGYPPDTQEGCLQPRCTKWSQLGDAGFNRQFLRSLGRDSSGQAQGFDYARGRKAVFLFKNLRQTGSVDALIFVRDLDDQATKRRRSLEQVRIDSPEAVLVLATPNPKQEAWVLNGFVPSKDEEPVLAALRHELGFDPCHKADELSARDETAKRSAHRVVKQLLGESRERKEQCWVATQLSDLRKHGEKTFLNAYLEEVKEILLQILDPSFTHRKAQG